MNDQKTMWDDIHEQGSLDNLRFKASEFVKKIEPEILNSSSILELGCGSGGDARYLAGLGHEVCATDFSKIAIEKNRQDSAGVDFGILDMSKALPFGDEQFNVVYANLSLHYFDDKTTRSLFSEIHRVLSIEGKLIFRCKSIYSQSEKHGAEEIAPNIFMQNGHLRHLFSREYAEKLLQRNEFKVLRNEYTDGVVYGKQAHFVEGVAKKRAGSHRK